MEKIRDLIKTVAGSLGWGLLGIVILLTGIFPAWVGWMAVITAGCCIACAADKALTPDRGYRYG
jgi:hypothetical protein